ncbi:hypothetical protein KYY02_13030 [Streptomyces pimonensis]|uniref:ABC transmembrane type-1 domain-containing protein n=1 Tax=Streptomyces pimonensis TaxID=2860288 RepID=A0ABV4IY23_9ACTN
MEERGKAAGRMLAETMPRLLAGGLAVQLCFAALVTTGVTLALNDAVEPAALVALLALAARFVGPLSEAAGMSGMLRVAGNDLGRLAALLEEPPLPGTGSSAVPERPGEIVFENVAFENVAFGYDDGNPVLRNVSLRVPPHTMTAVVGASRAATRAGNADPSEPGARLGPDGRRRPSRRCGHGGTVRPRRRPSRPRPTASAREAVKRRHGA